MIEYMNEMKQREKRKRRRNRKKKIIVAIVIVVRGRRRGRGRGRGRGGGRGRGNRHSSTPQRAAGSLVVMARRLTTIAAIDRLRRSHSAGKLETMCSASHCLAPRTAAREGVRRV